MRRLLPIAAVALLAMQTYFVQGQDAKKVLASKGWGSLSGKVTLDGPIPAPISLIDKMKASPDAACCLAKDAKPEEKIDTTWVVDPKTKAVANVIVWIKPPKGEYFPLPPNYKPNKKPLEIDQPHCAFIPRISAYNPVNIIDGKEVPTGQKVLFKNGATVPHNIRATGQADKENSFNVNVPGKTEITKSFEPQRLPINLQCDVHTWMAAKLAVFDHPYFAITNEKGEFTIPQAPAGAQVYLMAWHEGVGYVLPELRAGKALTLTAGKNTVNLTVKMR